MPRRGQSLLHDVTRLVLALVLWTNLCGGVLAAAAPDALPLDGQLCLPVGDAGSAGPDEEDAPNRALHDGHCVLCQLPSLAGGLTAEPSALPAPRAAPARTTWGAPLLPAGPGLHRSDIRRFHAPPPLT